MSAESKRWECVVWTCYCYVFWAKCGYRESRWYAHENIVNCVELKACNWNLGTGA